MRRLLTLLLWVKLLGSIEVQGHRGMQGLYPENTLPSFAAAIEAGVDAIELDVLSSLDNIFVIHHDFGINKRTVTKDGTPLQGQPLISSLTLFQIKELDCGKNPNPQFPKQMSIPYTQIPTLQELFDLVNKTSKTVRINVEIKRDPRDPKLTAGPKKIATRLVAEVRRSGLADRVEYCSFDPESLAEIRQLDPHATIGFLFSPQNVDNHLSFEKKNELMVGVATQLKAQFLSIDHEFLKNREQVQSLKQKGFQVLAWTVNEPARWQELIEMGVDGIITDYPVNLIKFIR